VRQKGSDINVPPSLFLVYRFGVVDDGNEPVSILPEVEHHIPVDTIGIGEHAANFREFLPTNNSTIVAQVLISFPASG
jgi:hypothetical protein